MTEIALKIANQVIQLPEPRPRLVAGSAGVYAVTLAYDAQWDDATVRVVVFDGGLCNQRVPVQDTSGTVPIPPECIAHGGRGNWLQIGVLGYDGTGALRITTRAMLDGLRIDPAGASDADVPQDPPAATPGLWEKLVADVGNLSDLQTADTSSLVAAINELAAKPAGYKPYPIALTQNGNKWTADHTIAEVKEALAQGYSPYCVYNSWPIPCTGVEDNYVYYTGWLGNQTTAVWIMQSKSGVTVIARNTFGVDRLPNLIDSDGGFGGLNALIATNPRTAVVYNLGGTPEGQDLSAMTFPALLWGTATDATARTQTFGLTGAGGDQWRGVQNFDTKAVTFEQVWIGTKIYTLTLDKETETISVNCTWAELAAAVKSGATVMLDAGELEPGASHVVLTARVWHFDDNLDGEVYFQSDPGIIPGQVAEVVCRSGGNDTVSVEFRSESTVTEDLVHTIVDNAVNNLPQADWAQENTSRADHIKNRPFYAVTTETKTGLGAAAINAMQQFGSIASVSVPISNWGDSAYAIFYNVHTLLGKYPLTKSYNTATGVYTYSNTDVGLTVSGATGGKVTGTIGKLPDALKDADIISFDSIVRTTKTTVSDELAAWVKTQASIFPVTITGSGTEANPYVSDKTCNEISAAYKAGKLPVCKHPQSATYGPSDVMCVYQEYLYPPGGPGRVEFASTSEEYSYYVTIYSDGDVSAGYRPRFMTGASATRGGSGGFVPGPGQGDQNKFLRGDATWADPPTDHTLGLTSATVGQIAKITAVDDNGAPTAWEAVDIKSDDLATWINEKIDAKLGVIENGAY